MGKKKIVCLLVVVLVSCFCDSVLAGMRKEDNAEYRKEQLELDNKTETFDGDSAELASTAILPTLDTPMVDGKNNVWCSSFQLVWNRMKKSHIREPIRLEGAEEICERLNTAKQSKDDLEPEAYYINAGRATPGFIQKIRNDMAKRFPDVRPSSIEPNGDLVAYAYLETYLKFRIPFELNSEPLIFTDSNGNKTPVKSFKEWTEESYDPFRYRQVDVLYCDWDENEDVTEFAIDLCVGTKPYQVVVAMIEPGETMEGTYRKLQKKIDDFKKEPNYKEMKKFSSSDKLRVPDMFWKVTHNFTEIEGKKITNKRFNDMPITTAMQMINFRLDRSGAILKSESMFRMGGLPPKKLPEVREYILDKPFMIYLKKREAEQPFFVMWVDNAELLTQF